MRLRMATAGALAAAALGLAWTSGVQAHLISDSGSPSAATACTDSWTNAAGGDFNNLNNWSAGHVPTSADDACITLAGTYTVSLGRVNGGVDSTTVKSLTIGGASGTQTLVVHGINGTGDTYLTATNAVTNNAHGSIVLDCQDAAHPCADGREFLQAQGTLSNSGSITTRGNGSTVYLEGNLSNAGGTIQINDSAVFAALGYGPVTLVNQGTIALADGSTLTTDQTVTNGSGGSIVASGSGLLSASGTFNEGAGTTSGAPVRLTSGATLNFTGAGGSSFVMYQGGNFGLSGSLAAGQSLLIHGVNGTGDSLVYAASGFTNAGSITLDCQTAQTACSGGSEFLIAAATLTNSGTITASGNGSTVRLQGNISNGGALQINGSAVFSSGVLSQTGGTTTVASGATLDVSGSAGSLSLSGGTLDGTGTVIGSVSNSGGTVAPGSSPGTLTVAGDYSQGAGGTLAVDVAGTAPGQFDVLHVSGDVTLDGTLALLPSAGYAASSATGDSVTFLPYGSSRTGAFATTTVTPPLSAGKPFTALYNDGGKHIDAAVGPSSPTAVTAVAGNGSVAVSWTEAVAGLVTRYDVTCSPACPGAGGLTVTGTPAAQSTTITGLVYGTSYAFTVTAGNAAGTSVASAVSNAVTFAAAPSAPTNAVAVAGNATASLTWSAPSSNGSAITGYTVACIPACPVAGGLSVAGTSTTVTGLTNGTTYTFTVTATNGRGTSAPSAPSNAVTPAAVPGAPTSVTATAGSGSATVRWTAPTDTGGSTITGYVVTPYVGTVAQTPTRVGNVTSTTVSGLTNGTTYTFTVAATNALGTGPASSPSNAVKPAALTPPAVRPVIGKPVTMPKKLLAGKTATVSFKITRSDNGKNLTAGRMICNPSVKGKVIPHREQFKNGTATLRVKIPKTAKGKLLKVHLTIKYKGQTTSRTSTFRIR
jgi:Fibronectin type III domain